MKSFLTVVVAWLIVAALSVVVAWAFAAAFAWEANPGKWDPAWRKAFAACLALWVATLRVRVAVQPAKESP